MKYKPESFKKLFAGNMIFYNRNMHIETSYFTI